MDGLFAVGAAAPDPPLKFLKGGGLDKDLKALREAATHLARPLQFDLQQHRPAPIKLLLHRLARRAVAMAREFGPLEQAASSDAFVEVLAAEEEIVLPIPFAAAGRTGGG